MYGKEDYGIENLTVACTDSFYTKDPFVTYHLTGGRAQIYVVPHKNGEPQRRVALCTVKEGQMIPPLCHADGMSHTDWFFGIAALDEKITMEVVPAAPTQVLCRAFLEKAGVDTYAMEGFEGSLIEVYLREVLKDRVYIERSEKGGKAAQEAQIHFIYDFFAGNDTQPGYDSNAFLRTAAYALKALGVKLPAPDRIANSSRLTLDDLRDRAEFNYRDVVLDPDWYAHDCGVVLGMSQGRPVACVPGAGGRYTAYFGDEKRKIKLTKSVAATIEPRAKVLERSLPDGKLSVKQVAGYVLRGLRKGDIAWVALLEAACTLIGILLPKLNQLIYDEYIPMGSSGVLIEMCAFIGAFMIGNVFFSLVKSLFSFVVQTRAGCDIQDAAYRRIFHMSESFLRKYESADLAERLMSVGSTVNGMIAKALTTGLASVISFLYIFQMLKYAKSLTFLSLLMAAAYALLAMSFSLAAVKKTKVIAEKRASSSSRLYQFITGIDKIRMSGAEDRMLLQYMGPFMEGQQAAIGRGRLDKLSDILMGAGSTVFSMVLYYLIVKRDLKLSMGSFIAFNTAFGTVSGSLMSLIGLWLEYKKVKPTVERFSPIMTEENERTEGKDEIGELKGAIALDHVTFSYGDNAKPVLNDLSLSVSPGEYVGIVGPSGCGKSTILKLLLGFEKPQRGHVYYDGKDMNTVNLNSLRRHLGTVLQNGQLISGSIYENISISVNNATMGDVMKVVEMVGLKDDIAQMPMGIQTMVSESGGTISGGQKQRILIARAIFNDPQVLLFDEATSALDNLTQAMVSGSLDSMNITRIVIAHRLSTIRNCDRILVIDAGEVAEEGDYDSLMAKRGMFWQMAMRQLTEEDEAYEENGAY